MGFLRPDWTSVARLGLLDVISARYEYWAAESERVRSLEEQNDQLVLAASRP